jgi:nucleoid-associated protein YgaU
MANVDGFLRTVRQDIVNPAPAPEPTPEPAPTPAGNVYVVQPGDTLSEIGDSLGVNWVDLYEANRDVVGDNPNLIFPGQELRY